MEPGASFAVPGDRASEMRLPSPPLPTPLSWASTAAPEASPFASGNPPEAEPHAPPFDSEERITLNVQAEALLNRLRLGRRRRAAMATAATALVAFSLVCGGVHCVYNVLGYAELASEMTVRFDPLVPEHVVLTYRPAKAGHFVLRREGVDRTTEFFGEIPEEEVGHEQALLWQVDGLRNGELLTARYRQGWKVVTQEWPVPQVSAGGVGKTTTAD